MLPRPLALAGRVLVNRVVFGAHLTNFGLDNAFSPRHLAYYRERAAGGVALIVTEALTVHALDWPYEHVPFGHREQIIPSLRALASAVRQANSQTLLLAQLNHSGGQSSGRLLRQSPWAPSPWVEPASRRMARAMLEPELREVVRGFAETAARVVRAGLDGVELNAGQWSLLRQFLSPLTNTRQDAHGGPWEHRLRFVQEVRDAVRSALDAQAAQMGAPRPLLGLKLCGDELAPWGGLTVNDAVRFALRLAEGGGLDYVAVQVGGPYSTFMSDAPMPVPEGHGAHLAAAIRQALRGQGYSLPVLAEGRIESLATAERILGAGPDGAPQADAVDMTRALISDPLLPRKAAWQALGQGHAEGEEAQPVRPHIGHARYFAVRGDWNRPLGDLSNPRAGREALWPALEWVAGARQALVVGGGPAGLETAITLARLGWNVTLVEQAPRLGGFAAVLPCVSARQEYQRLVEYHLAMVQRLGITVHTGLRFAGTEEHLAGRPLAAYEAIYLATGAQAPVHARIKEGPGSVPVLSARDLLLGTREPLPRSGRVAVVDEEYGLRMGNAVEYLLERGYGVDVVSEDFYVGRELVECGEFAWFQRVALPRPAPGAAGEHSTGQTAALHPRLQALALEGDSLRCAERFSRRERLLGPLAFVVLAQQELPQADVYHTLTARLAGSGTGGPVPRVVTVGDARAPRQMGEAILHAQRTVVLGG